MLIKESEKSASLQPQLNIYKEGPGQSCVYSPLSDVKTVTSGQLISAPLHPVYASPTPLAPLVNREK